MRAEICDRQLHHKTVLIVMTGALLLCFGGRSVSWAQEGVDEDSDQVQEEDPEIARVVEARRNVVREGAFWAERGGWIIIISSIVLAIGMFAALLFAPKSPWKISRYESSESKVEDVPKPRRRDDIWH